MVLFCWGPTNEEPTGKEFLLMITEGVPCNCVFVEVTVDDVDISTIAGVKEVLANSKNDFVKGACRKDYTDYLFGRRLL